MKEKELKAELRKEFGKNQVKKLRLKGLFPCNIYGGKENNLSITLDERQYLKAIRDTKFKKNILLKLVIQNGKKVIEERCITKSIDFHPVTKQVEHVDFVRIFDDKKLEIPVKIITTGISKGQKMGGMLIQSLDYVMIRMYPKDIIDNIEIDIKHLELGDLVKVSDLSLSDSVEIVSDLSNILLKIEAPRVEKAVEEVSSETTEDGSVTDSVESDEKEPVTTP